MRSVSMPDKLSTEAIKDCIDLSQTFEERAQPALVTDAEAELAAILKRIEEQETQIAVMRNALAATPPTAGSRRP